MLAYLQMRERQTEWARDRSTSVPSLAISRGRYRRAIPEADFTRLQNVRKKPVPALHERARHVVEPLVFSLDMLQANGIRPVKCRIFVR